MKLITVIGARPQFIKAATVSKAIQTNNACNASRIQEIIVHTGQHYDENMSEVFFTELEIPRPDYNLGIVAATHGAMTGQMLEQLEIVLLKEKPDIVLIYGDTNSTLAGALAATKLHIPVAHVEAGLRSFNVQMPEEINRILADRISHLLFCPTETAISNLAKESILNGVHNVGDVMYDMTLRYRDKAYQLHSLHRWKLEEKAYVLCTIHRAENTNDSIRLTNIMTALQQIAQEMTVILPLHPRTRKWLKDRGEMHLLKSLQVIEPVSYLEMLRLEMSAKVILTDSGGVQKEAFFHKVPCITLRDETEWVETLNLGWNQLCGANLTTILEAWHHLDTQNRDYKMQPYGDGKAAEKIINFLRNI